MRLLRFWKPYGVLTAFTDQEGRPTLADYIRVPGVYAAGRLDMDSEGLLLLTDSGRLNALLTQPQHGHPRTYWVLVEGTPDQAALDALCNGIPLADKPGMAKMTLPANVRVLAAPPQVNGEDLPERAEAPIAQHRLNRATWLELTLTEGRNRQVRRMTAAVGLPTLRLVRAQIGGGRTAIRLDGLHPGGWADVDAKTTQALLRSLR